MTNYHHTVIEKATPSVDFTKWCTKNDDKVVRLPNYAAIRRANLSRFVRAEMDGNLSLLARTYNPDKPRPNYFSDLLRDGSNKSFAFQAARQIEAAVGLVQGQLDIQNSPLLMEKQDDGELDQRLAEGISDLDRLEKQQMLAFQKELVRSRTKRKRA